MTTKVTPTGTIDWYIKWVASILILIALSLRASGFSVLLDIALSSVGTLMWLIVAFMWKDRALIVVNTAALFLLLVWGLRYLQ